MAFVCPLFLCLAPFLWPVSGFVLDILLVLGTVIPHLTARAVHLFHYPWFLHFRQHRRRLLLSLRELGQATGQRYRALSKRDTVYYPWLSSWLMWAWAASCFVIVATTGRRRRSPKSPWRYPGLIAHGRHLVFILVYCVPLAGVVGPQKHLGHIFGS